MAKTITRDDVAHVAKLANLPVSDDQITTFQKQLSSILSYIKVIQDTNTDNIPETHQTTGLTNVLRDDRVEVERMLTQQQALANAKKVHHGYFVVSAILD